MTVVVLGNLDLEFVVRIVLPRGYMRNTTFQSSPFCLKENCAKIQSRPTLGVSNLFGIKMNYGFNFEVI